jgi:hypothetical protein
VHRNLAREGDEAGPRSVQSLWPASAHFTRDGKLVRFPPATPLQKEIAREAGNILIQCEHKNPKEKTMHCLLVHVPSLLCGFLLGKFYPQLKCETVARF